MIHQTTPTSKSSPQPENHALKVGSKHSILLQPLIVVIGLADRWATAAHYYNSCGPTEVTALRNFVDLTD